MWEGAEPALADGSGCRWVGLGLAGLALLSVAAGCEAPGFAASLPAAAGSRGGVDSIAADAGPVVAGVYKRSARGRFFRREEGFFHGFRSVHQQPLRNALMSQTNARRETLVPPSTNVTLFLTIGPARPVTDDFGQPTRVAFAYAVLS